MAALLEFCRVTKYIGKQSARAHSLDVGAGLGIATATSEPYEVKRLVREIVSRVLFSKLSFLVNSVPYIRKPGARYTTSFYYAESHDMHLVY
jgi:hypothetical protein